jgi:hypothetical protein
MRPERRCAANAALAAVALLLAQEERHALALPAGVSSRDRGVPVRAISRRRLQNACDTAGVGDYAVDGDGMLMSVEGRQGQGDQESADDTTTAGAAVPGAFVNGEGISAEQMDLAYTNFACDPGWTLDTSVSWVCDVDGGIAKLSGQPCLSGIPPEGGVRLFYIIFGLLCAITYLACWALHYEKVEKKEKVDDEGKTLASLDAAAWCWCCLHSNVRRAIPQLDL